MQAQIIEHSEFFRAEDEHGEIRFYPSAGPTAKQDAIDFDAHSDPVRIMGFGVMDLDVSRTYAIKLCNSTEEAHSFIAGMNTPATDEPPETPETPEPPEPPEPEPTVSYKPQRGSTRRSRGK